MITSNFSYKWYYYIWDKWRIFQTIKVAEHLLTFKIITFQEFTYFVAALVVAALMVVSELFSIRFFLKEHFLFSFFCTQNISAHVCGHGGRTMPAELKIWFFSQFIFDEKRKLWIDSTKTLLGLSWFLLHIEVYDVWKPPKSLSVLEQWPNVMKKRNLCNEGAVYWKIDLILRNTGMVWAHIAKPFLKIEMEIKHCA